MQTPNRFRGGIKAALPTAAFALALLTPVMAQAQTGAQLRVLSPRAGESLGTSNFKLDVSFQTRTNLPATGAELWMDGVRWAHRDFDTPQVKNVLTFTVDGSTLSGGTHTAIVKLFCVGGGVATTKLSLIAGTNSGIGEVNTGGPIMSFAAPLNGKRVSGTVELELSVQSRNGINPYVTIYVDKQFKTLKNYPPYTYSWDTTTVANGFHTIEATGYIESVNATTNRRIKLLVDNAGGNTVRMNGIPDLSHPAPILSTLPAHTGPTLTIPLPKRPVSRRSHLLLPTGTARFSRIVPTSAHATPTSVGIQSLPNAVPNALELQPVAPFVAAPRATRPSVSVPVRMSGLAVAPVRVRPVTLGTTLPPLHPTIQVKRGTVVPVAHSVKAAPHIIVNGKRYMMRSDAAEAMNPSLQPRLQIAFDGQRIAFDVAPRVEAGLPLAPFRQIFEHTGGQVTWVSQTHTVHAVNADREITLGIGKKTATVNGESMVIERTPYIEQGRTIVPLSFVGKAMDVKINYDPATGRLQITSK